MVTCEGFVLVGSILSRWNRCLGGDQDGWPLVVVWVGGLLGWLTLSSCHADQRSKIRGPQCTVGETMPAHPCNPLRQDRRTALADGGSEVRPGLSLTGLFHKWKQHSSAINNTRIAWVATQVGWHPNIYFACSAIPFLLFAVWWSSIVMSCHDCDVFVGSVDAPLAPSKKFDRPRTFVRSFTWQA